MNFTLSGDQRALQETAQRFAREQMIPVAQSMETEAQPLNREWARR